MMLRFDNTVLEKEIRTELRIRRITKDAQKDFERREICRLAVQAHTVLQEDLPVQHISEAQRTAGVFREDGHFLRMLELYRRIAGGAVWNVMEVSARDLYIAITLVLYEHDFGFHRLPSTYLYVNPSEEATDLINAVTSARTQLMDIQAQLVPYVDLSSLANLDVENYDITTLEVVQAKGV